jgi:hypothetical protein
MAVADWRRYYAPILSHKTSGECRIWQGKLFRDYEKVTAKVVEINAAKTGNWRCIGIARLKGKTPAIQQLLWADTRP